MLVSSCYYQPKVEIIELLLDNFPWLVNDTVDR